MPRNFHSTQCVKHYRIYMEKLYGDPQSLNDPDFFSREDATVKSVGTPVDTDEWSVKDITFSILCAYIDHSEELL